MSAVGFDASKRRATVYIIEHRGPDSVRGYVRLLERGEHGWEVLNLGILCGFVT